jgi:5'-nucleotidase
MLNRSAILVVVLAMAVGLTTVLPSEAAKVHHVPLQLLAVNDFHGALPAGIEDGRPIGGAATLATYLAQAEYDFEEATGGSTMVLGAGDLIGASPPVSGLVHDAPTIEAFGLMGMTYSAAGNHEFDDGVAELLRVQNGGCHADGSCTGRAPYQYLAANVVDEATGEPVLPPYDVEEIDGVRVGFIGVAPSFTASIVTPSGVAGVEFLDEAAAVNKYAAELTEQGVETIVVLLHSGGEADAEADVGLTGGLSTIVEAIDDDVDVVISGHTRSSFVTTIDGKLVTQASSSGVAFADIDLVVDRDSGDVVSKQATIVGTWGDVFPGSTPHPRVQTLVEKATNAVAPLIDRVVGTAATDITRAQSAAGESALGNLIADSQRAKGGTQLAFVNHGSMRADLAAGDVTWGDLFAIEPFGNDLIRQTLTGAQIDALLEQQWTQEQPRVLQVSGIEYTWSAAAAPGARVDPAEVFIEGAPLDLDATYTVTSNAFVAAGGDGFTVLTEGADREVVGGSDADAFVEWVEGLPAGFTATIEGRITVE